ncbi:MAG: alanine racemase [Nannocystaceae bacterium]
MDPRFRRRPTHLRVDLTALGRNLKVIRGASGDARVMAILKADAYGHGLLPIAHKLADLGVDYFGVAFAEEGIALRQAGIEAPILVLGGLVGYQLKHFLDYHLEITAASPFKARQISDEATRLGRVARVHIKVDTGMGRLGVRPETAVQLALQLRTLPGVETVGIYSHLVEAEAEHSACTDAQVGALRDVLARLRGLGLHLPRAHLANTAAILRCPEARFDMVRPGIGLYGVTPGAKPEVGVELWPVLSARTEVVFVKGIRKGAGIGYGHTWHAPRDGWVATLPVGYGDGYPRALSNRGEVLIGGRRFAVVGNMSMDQTTIWLDDAMFSVGTEVVLLGRQGGEEIGAWELAGHGGTIAYDILCGWAARVPRVYV